MKLKFPWQKSQMIQACKELTDMQLWESYENLDFFVVEIPVLLKKCQELLLNNLCKRIQFSKSNHQNFRGFSLVLRLLDKHEVPPRVPLKVFNRA